MSRLRCPIAVTVNGRRVAYDTFEAYVIWARSPDHVVVSIPPETEAVLHDWIDRGGPPSVALALRNAGDCRTDTGDELISYPDPDTMIQRLIRLREVQAAFPEYNASYLARLCGRTIAMMFPYRPQEDIEEE